MSCDIDKNFIDSKPIKRLAVKVLHNKISLFNTQVLDTNIKDLKISIMQKNKFLKKYDTTNPEKTFNNNEKFLDFANLNNVNNEYNISTELENSKNSPGSLQNKNNIRFITSIDDSQLSVSPQSKKNYFQKYTNKSRNNNDLSSFIDNSEIKNSVNEFNTNVIAEKESLKQTNKIDHQKDSLEKNSITKNNTSNTIKLDEEDLATYKLKRIKQKKISQHNMSNLSKSEIEFRVIEGETLKNLNLHLSENVSPKSKHNYAKDKNYKHKNHLKNKSKTKKTDQYINKFAENINNSLKKKQRNLHDNLDNNNQINKDLKPKNQRESKIIINDPKIITNLEISANLNKRHKDFISSANKKIFQQDFDTDKNDQISYEINKSQPNILINEDYHTNINPNELTRAHVKGNNTNASILGINDNLPNAANALQNLSEYIRNPNFVFNMNDVSGKNSTLYPRMKIFDRISLMSKGLLNERYPIKDEKIFGKIFNKNLENILEMKKYPIRASTQEKVNIHDERNQFAKKDPVSKEVVNLKEKVYFLKGTMDYIFPHFLIGKLKESLKHSKVEGNSIIKSSEKIFKNLSSTIDPVKIKEIIHTRNTVGLDYKITTEKTENFFPDINDYKKSFTKDKIYLYTNTNSNVSNKNSMKTNYASYRNKINLISNETNSSLFNKYKNFKTIYKRNKSDNVSWKNDSNSRSYLENKNIPKHKILLKSIHIQNATSIDTQTVDF